MIKSLISTSHSTKISHPWRVAVGSINGIIRAAIVYSAAAARNAHIGWPEYLVVTGPRTVFDQIGASFFCFQNQCFAKTVEKDFVHDSK